MKIFLIILMFINILLNIYVLSRFISNRLWPQAVLIGVRTNDGKENWDFVMHLPTSEWQKRKYLIVRVDNKL